MTQKLFPNVLKASEVSSKMCIKKRSLYEVTRNLLVTLREKY